MTINRRHFLGSISAITASLSLSMTTQLHAAEKAKKSLNILILGGTGYIGPHMVQRCTERGHKVTLFNRGKRNTHLFPDIETIVGNRDPEVDEGLSGLTNRKWDMVIDNSGYIPRHVDASAKKLKNACDHYLFISTVAVYSDFSILDADETAPLKTIEDPGSEDARKYYGELKVLCENAVKKYFPDNHTILRPTYIVGPGDHTDRFIHYIDRPMQGGIMAMPGMPDNHIAYVDVRDLAAHTVRCLENNIVDTQNMVNKPRTDTWGQFIDHSVSLSQSKVEVEWLSLDFLKTQEGFDGPYTPFPMWSNDYALDSRGKTNLSQARAVASGFKNRPFKDTITDTFNWWMQQSVERRTTKKRKNFTMEMETDLLAAWNKYKA
jgi:2'-hydroxyisoflavone reductase